MRHVLVTRASLAIVALLVAASSTFAWLASRSRATPERPERDSSPPIDGERVFAGACASCHAARELADRLRAAADVETAAREMETFLADHGEATGAEDRAIVAFLRALAADG
jgi:mono/diheme cytochrome c family protein